MNGNTSARMIVWGLVGGLVATIIMDLACAGLFVGVGMPVDLTYSFIGNVAGGFLSQIGFDSLGGRFLGAVVHFAIGVILGGLYGLMVSRIGFLRAYSLKRNLIFAILYIEIFSQPILVTAPLFANLSLSDVVNWYVLSLVMHSVFGAVLGIIVKYSPRTTMNVIHAT